ncbi:hypothetical protein VOLCADRAFT_96773 [Volvox carteri f. nagariensis]|uniref:Kinesin motor domain-containing protein n=1 Tax=Volvox carteri f. nagariensis TaxID=3068 RepID=D8UB06_VOLCA|nr:uncharacterized protein VOLCADRAFT_96773 [Volvox carteri f. nagariensis]EFJ43029.1 hypothetical protein VOLCADRAFT_96773 [Volvox carteri f. nagariensis]|eukprot:XP_002955828.1 hypothetical protein VOLCADRAFT_96773 [Volvox carteri f. nagariensis]
MAEVRAAVRIRPPIRSGGPPLSIKGQYGQFAFDYVVEEGASQEVTFTECILPQVNNFLQGTSSTVLVYGASSTGKSYTLEGGPPSARTEGAIPRAMHAICKNLAVVPKHRYKLYVTYCALSAGIEAQMVDLLAPGSPAVSLKDSSASSALARLLHYQVDSHEEIYEVLRQGRTTRAAAFGGGGGGGSAAGAGPTSNSGASASGNGRASRPVTSAAHVMLNIQLTGFAASGEQLATNLTFVELAAPEAKDMMGYPATADSGLTRSLSLAYASLTAVVTALRGGSGGNGSRPTDSPSRGHTHVPWRDSPLTRWLKGCLDGSGSILAIATVAPGPEAAADTLATLSYVNRLRSGPKSDGLIVTATWDSSDPAASAGLEAAVTQVELQNSLQRAAQAQRERQERERELQERQRERERERERFGSPIPVRASPSMAGAPPPPPAGSRPQSTSRSAPASSPRRQLDPESHLQLPTVQPFRSTEALSRQVEQLRAELGSERRECQRLRSEISSLEAAQRAASDLAEASAAAALGELRGQLEALRKQLETSEGAKQLLMGRVQQLQEQQGSLLDLQAESSMLEAQVRALQDSLGAARSGQSSLAAQLADAKAAADALRQDRDRLQRQNHDLSDKLQAQVRSLSEETSRLRSQALEAASQMEAEQAGRRAAESALAQLRLQVEGSRSCESSALQQAASLANQVKELSAALESEAKWRSEERSEQLSLDLEGAMTQVAKAEMEARAASTKAESDLRSAISAAEGFKAELKAARSQALDSVRQELRVAQLTAEDAARRESAAQTDVQELEALLRELDRDLEVEVNAVWRQLRAERADSLFGVPEGGAVAPARRWRPVLQALVGIMKRNANEAERQGQALEQARERILGMEAQVARANELASSLAAHQQLKAAHLTELEESHRSIALMDQALAEANRECQRLHRQLEELSAAHKALTMESAARESRLQAQATEREVALQAQLSEKEERLRAAMADQEKRVQVLSAEWEAKLAAQSAERDARLHSAVMDAEARLQSSVSEREARLVAAVADGEARLHKAVLDADARFHEAITEREARLAALASERESLQRQISTMSALQSEDKQERDMLRLRAHRRDHLLNIVWSEPLSVSSPQRSAASGGAGMGAGIGVGSASASSAGGPAAAASHGPVDSDSSVVDWEDPTCQEKLIKGLTTLRVQVGKLQAELNGLRSGIGVTEELTGQLAAAKARLADSQRSTEEFSSRVVSLEMDLREEQAARSVLQQQLASHEASAAALQSSLLEARQTAVALQEEVAVITKSRDTWKETATQQEAQLRELYSEGETRAGELSRLRAEAQSANTEASGASARARLLESQLQDAKDQLDTLSARLAATDKALSDANVRAASLNGQLVLAESETRLKTQELLARVQAAEDGERLAKANAKEAMERLETRLRDASEQGGKLVADLDALRAERNEAQLRADELQRHLAEARARLSDLEHSGKLVHKLMAERDALQDQVNTLRNANMQVTDEARSLRRTLDSIQEQLHRATEEKMRLAAQVEGQRLEAIMNSMAPRTAGRIGALARPTGSASAAGAIGGSLATDLSVAGAPLDPRSAPAGFNRSYAGLSCTGIGSYAPPPSLGASPSLPSVARPAYAVVNTPYTPTTTTAATTANSNPSTTATSVYEATVKQTTAEDRMVARMAVGEDHTVAQEDRMAVLGERTATLCLRNHH